MLLSLDNIDLLLKEMNAPANLCGLQDLLSGSEQIRWREKEEQPFCTNHEPLRRYGLSWAEDICRVLQRNNGGFPQIIAPTDFYYYGGDSLDLPEAIERPVVAVKIFDSVFSYSSLLEQWSERPWLGLGDDYLLRLPYIGHYDFDRVKKAAQKEEKLRESLMRAHDLISLFKERVHQAQTASDKFELPALEDIQQELAEDGLSLARGDLFGECISYELCLLEKEQPRFPGIVEGRYRGALSEIRLPSSASVKRMVERSLTKLLDNLDLLINPLDLTQQRTLIERRHNLLEEFSL
jgi:hypothetical protein